MPSSKGTFPSKFIILSSLVILLALFILRYVSQLQKCRVGGIEGFNISANCLMQTNLSPEQLAVLWKTLSSNFERFIDRYKEICQKDKDGNLDFSTVELMLVFPFVKFLNTTSRHTWNQWGKLFKQVR